MPPQRGVEPLLGAEEIDVRQEAELDSLPHSAGEVKLQCLRHAATRLVGHEGPIIDPGLRGVLNLTVNDGLRATVDFYITARPDSCEKREPIPVMSRAQCLGNSLVDGTVTIVPGIPPDCSDERPRLRPAFHSV